VKTRKIPSGPTPRDAASDKKPGVKRCEVSGGEKPPDPAAAARSSELSIRQRKYVAGVLAGKTKAAAARQAGYSASVALHAKEKIESSKKVAQLLDDYMRKAGVTEELLAMRVREGLDAVVTKCWLPHYLYRPMKSNKVEQQNRKGQAEYNAEDQLISRTFIDYAERRAYIELAIKLMGIKPASDSLEELTLEALITESWGT
jgi:hypothetical protein